MGEMYLPSRENERPLGLINPCHAAAFILKDLSLLDDMSKIPSGTNVQLEDRNHLVFVHRGPPETGNTKVRIERHNELARTPSGTIIHYFDVYNIIGYRDNVYGEKHDYREVRRGGEAKIQRVEYPETIEPLDKDDIDMLRLIVDSTGVARRQSWIDRFRPLAALARTALLG